MTTTEHRPGALATARRNATAHKARLDELLLAVDLAEQGGATVMRLDTVRAIVGATVGEMGLGKARRTPGRSR